MGVITVTDINYGQIFGPFPSHLAMADPVNLIASLTNDKRQDGVILKVDPLERKEGIKAVEWLPYIQPARDEEEQNMEAYLKEGHVYFRSLSIIRAAEELLVWFSKDLCQLLVIPELPRHIDKGNYIMCIFYEYKDFWQLLVIPELSRHIDKDEDYICQRCGEVFEFPFPMRAHLKFKCAYNTSVFSPAAVSLVTKHPLDQRESAIVENNNHSKTDFPHIYPNNHKELRGEDVVSAFKTLSDQKKDIKYGEQGRKRNANRDTEQYKDEREAGSDNQELLVKDSSSKHIQLHPGLRDLSPRSSDSSAFKKVKKSQSPMKEQLTPMSRPDPVISTLKHSLPSHNGVSEPTMVANSMVPIQHEEAIHQHMFNLYMPRLALLPPSNLSRNVTPSSNLYSDPRSQGLGDVMHGPVGRMPGPLTERFLNTKHKGSEHESFPKQMVLFDRMNVNVPFMKYHNPMVDCIVNTGTNPTLMNNPRHAMNLSQNWCAKCNASFRMTSDLVYHMRSHHTREFDPVKKKRDDKLKCSVCNETFRERHHLTRHMTSHS
ncbi:uncharacterized protein LOC121379673 [Gigantopelta aegis]|uniref:uncharacterized protein LOC121379673 n=1 Tax=Gigantopelta aegis TaxID=1735272 RepID=UPI001B889CFF|nr:uncharacterized protein LOC121379673 [Gigantopelta aegis]